LWRLLSSLWASMSFSFWRQLGFPTPPDSSFMPPPLCKEPPSRPRLSLTRFLPGFRDHASGLLRVFFFLSPSSPPPPSRECKEFPRFSQGRYILFFPLFPPQFILLQTPRFPFRFLLFHPGVTFFPVATFDRDAPSFLLFFLRALILGVAFHSFP